METLRNNNYQLHFSYYQFTGEEAPMPLDDIESDDEDEDEDEDDEEDEEPDFLNYWTDPPIPTHRGPALDWWWYPYPTVIEIINKKYWGVIVRYWDTGEK